ncbi:MAG: DUF2892 domain-containing protein [Candidatus Riflebacteria bacterium]|nr:DUF2892 domain-containing protein [Candidatus Riflebacteria bacterium]
MVIERIVRIVAGSFIMLSLLLSRIHSPYWLLMTLFVGANLFQSGFTRWCLLEDILKAAGFQSCCSVNAKSTESKNVTSAIGNEEKKS